MATIEVLDRFKDYKKGNCWQYQIRVDNLEEDLAEAGLTPEEVKKLKVSDFEFKVIPKEDKDTCQAIVSFIKRHEWLGKMPTRPTHRFVAYYKGIMAGTVIMATPNAFSNLLGPRTREMEKLISRGACISWSPKNLASALISYAIRWMVKNTEFRVFTAYSDPEAKELGTIYQACNFYYLGQRNGGSRVYFDPATPHLGWISDRTFRRKRYYKMYAKMLDIEWRKEWEKPTYGIDWSKMPDDIEKKIRQKSKDYQNSLESRIVPNKHKYGYILGRNKTETRELTKLFKEHSPKLWGLSYPKQRGT